MKEAVAQLFVLFCLAIAFVVGAYMAVQALLVAANGRGFEQLSHIFP